MNPTKISNLLLLSGILLLISSCATVKFYQDPALKKETGLKVYAPKPYLLVEYQGTKTVSLKTSIVYLPDLSDPQYIRIKPGIGSAALKLELTNGVLTSYGLTTDTKIPEVLAKVTDLLTKSTASIASLTSNKTEAEPGQPAFELYEIIIINGQTKLVQVK
jgi:hypothetical protein